MRRFCVSGVVLTSLFLESVGMGTDLALLLGTAFCGFGMMLLISTLSTGRSSIAALMAFLVGGGFVYFALMSSTANYAFSDVPRIFMGAVYRLF